MTLFYSIDQTDTNTSSVTITRNSVPFVVCESDNCNGDIPIFEGDVIDIDATSSTPPCPILFRLTW